MIDTTHLEHPCLLASAKDFESLKLRVKNDLRVQRLAEAVLQAAERCLKAPAPEHKLKGIRLLNVSRQGIHDLLKLAMAFQLTGDRRFSRSAEQYLLAIAAFPDWNPSHFLDTAEMTLAVAIGYDWLNDELSPGTREILREAIKAKGILPSFENKYNRFWVNGTNNWNQVCHSGISAGAIALWNEEPDLARKVIARAVENVPAIMNICYDPDGNYPEGPGYWEYGTSYNVILIAMLEHAFGHDFGLLAQPGFSKTGEYLCHAMPPTGEAFDYSDTGAGKNLVAPILFWLSHRFQKPEWRVSQYPLLDGPLDETIRMNRFLPLLLLWLRPGSEGGEGESRPLDWCGHGKKPVAMHRSAWSPDAVYAGILGGKANISHGHMDAGSFIFEADGVRWASELGNVDYHSLEERKFDLWDYRQHGKRWEIFRVGPKAHNILMIDGAEQQVDGFGQIIRSAAVRAEMAGDKLKSFLKLIDLLEDNDDVQNVWHNADYEEDED